MTYVKRDITPILSYRNNWPADGMCNAHFVEDIRILACAVNNDCSGTRNKVNNILHDGFRIPDIVSANTFQI